MSGGALVSLARATAIRVVQGGQVVDADELHVIHNGERVQIWPLTAADAATRTSDVIRLAMARMAVARPPSRASDVISLAMSRMAVGPRPSRATDVIHLSMARMTVAEPPSRTSDVIRLAMSRMEVGEPTSRATDVIHLSMSRMQVSPGPSVPGRTSDVIRLAMSRMAVATTRGSAGSVTLNLSVGSATGFPTGPLATPATPTLVARTSTGLEVAVAAVEGATRYRWRISTDASVDDADSVNPTNTPSASYVSLESGTPYWIDVRAENDADSSGYSADLATATLVGVPDAPTVVSVTPTSVTMQVAAETGATSYRWRISELFPDDSSTMMVTTTPMVTFTGLEPLTMYHVDVRAENSDGNSAYSADGEATTTVPVPETPPAPTGVSHPDEMGLELSLPANIQYATRYRWRISTDATITDDDTVVTSVARVVDVDGLTPDTTYYFDVRAENSAGNSAYSEDGQAMTTYNVLTTAPTGTVEQWNEATNEMVFSWDALPGADSYVLRISMLDGTQIDAPSPSGTSYRREFTESERSQGFRWRVAGFNTSGTGPFSEWRNFSPFPPSVTYDPAAPVGSSTSITAMFSSTDGITSYVWQGTDPAGVSPDIPDDEYVNLPQTSPTITASGGFTVGLVLRITWVRNGAREFGPAVAIGAG